MRMRTVEQWLNPWTLKRWVKLGINQKIRRAEKKVPIGVIRLADKVVYASVCIVPFLTRSATVYGARFLFGEVGETARKKSGRELAHPTVS